MLPLPRCIISSGADSHNKRHHTHTPAGPDICTHTFRWSSIRTSPPKPPKKLVGMSADMHKRSKTTSMGDLGKIKSRDSFTCGACLPKMRRSKWSRFMMNRSNKTRSRSEGGEKSLCLEKMRHKGQEQRKRNEKEQRRRVKPKLKAQEQRRQNEQDHIRQQSETNERKLNGALMRRLVVKEEELKQSNQEIASLQAQLFRLNTALSAAERKYERQQDKSSKEIATLQDELGTLQAMDRQRWQQTNGDGENSEVREEIGALQAEVNTLKTTLKTKEKNLKKQAQSSLLALGAHTRRSKLQEKKWEKEEARCKKNSKIVRQKRRGSERSSKRIGL